MLPFVARLLATGQLKFERGRLTVFGRRVAIFPVELLLLLNEQCVKDPVLRRLVYTTMKESVYQFAVATDRAYKVKQDQMAEFLVNLAEMNGYGELKLSRLDYRKKEAIFHMRGLPSELQVGKVRPKVKTIDWYWAGMLAGGAAWVFGDRSVEAMETACVIAGADQCEFVVGRPQFLRRFSAQGLR